MALCIGSSTLAGSGTAPETVRGEPGKRLDAFLTEFANAGFSGSVLVARGGEILLQKGYGLADKSSKTPVTTETVFDIGSITKQFTAAAILKLEMAGKVSTNDAITKYFKNVPADKTGITLHHLLTHTAGFDHGYGADTDVAPRDETMKLFFSKTLLSAPGEKYTYSNSGFSILTAIVEMVSGKPYEQFLKTEFFDPLGMTQTGYRLPKWDLDKIARNYSGAKDNGPPLDRVWAPEGPYWHLFGNGGMLSTTADMYRWELALQGDKVLSASARAKLFKPYVPTNEARNRAFYAYGWRVGKTVTGHPQIGHGGFSDEMGVWATHYRFPDDGVVVIVLSAQVPVPRNIERTDLAERLADLAVGRMSKKS